MSDETRDPPSDEMPPGETAAEPTQEADADTALDDGKAAEAALPGPAETPARDLSAQEGGPLFGALLSDVATQLRTAFTDVARTVSTGDVPGSEPDDQGAEGDGVSERAPALAEASDEDEVGKVINLAAERLRRRGVQRSLDLREVLKREWSAFLSETSKSQTEKPSVTIDADFLSKHGPALVSKVLGRITQELVGPFPTAGAEPPAPDPEAASTLRVVPPPSEEPAAAEATGEPASPQPAEPPTPARVEVKFDVLSLLGALFRSASTAKASSRDPVHGKPGLRAVDASKEDAPPSPPKAPEEPPKP